MEIIVGIFVSILLAGVFFIVLTLIDSYIYKRSFKESLGAEQVGQRLMITGALMLVTSFFL